MKVLSAQLATQSLQILGNLIKTLKNRTTSVHAPKQLKYLKTAILID